MYIVNYINILYNIFILIFICCIHIIIMFYILYFDYVAGDRSL